MNDRRLLLSRKNLGRNIRQNIIHFFTSLNVDSIDYDSFLDLIETESIIDYISKTTPHRVDYVFTSWVDFKNFLNSLELPEEILLYTKDSEYCGLLRIYSLLVTNNVIEILSNPIFAGYFTIYLISENKKIEFDMEENEYAISIYQTED